MTEFLDTPVDKSLSATGAWTDIDLSADVPATATGAIFQVINDTSTYRNFGFRKNGSNDNRHRDIQRGTHYFAIIGIDADKKCEGYIEDTTVDFYLVGYTEADATFFTDSYDKTLTNTFAWTEIDLSAELPAGSVAAIFEVENTDSYNRDFGLRKKGSTDDRAVYMVGGTHHFFVVGVDGDRKCEGYVRYTTVKFHLIGYLTAGQAETNGIDRSLGSAGAYVDIDESGNAPTTATGIFGEVIASTLPYKYAVRKKGSSLDEYNDVDKHNAIFSGLDATKKWEGKIEYVGVDFYVLGYFTAVIEKYSSDAGVGVDAESALLNVVLDSDVGVGVEESIRMKLRYISLKLVQNKEIYLEPSHVRGRRV